MNKWLTRFVARRCRSVTKKRKPNYIIGGESNPYLLRWYVVRWHKFFSIYIHIFVRSDTDEALHDHPWSNISWILDGKYIEQSPATDKWPEDRTLKDALRKTGDVVFRKAEQAHRVQLIKIGQIEMPSLSLFITGPRVREWGFYCPKGWKHFKEFITNTETGNDRGKGCDV